MPSQSARLVATLPTLFTNPRTPAELVRSAGRRALVQRGDDELVVQRLDGDFRATGDALRFPAPWPRRFGSSAVAPDAGLAVFTGVHAVRAVDATGAVRWEVRHGCWYGACREMHRSFDEYADDRDHLYPERGSAAFSPDGRLVWAHVRGPLSEGSPHDGTPDDGALDEWLVLDARDGRVLARADARSAAAGSVHVPHPDPAQMGLSIGEGQDGAPLRWGRWDGERLTVDHFEDQDLVLMDVSPSGDRLLTVDHDQERLAVLRTEDGSALGWWDAEASVPPHPDADPDADELWLAWDWAGGFLDETTVLTGTVETDEEWGEGRHWLLRTDPPRPLEPITYPFPVSGLPTAIGDGMWCTTTESAMHIWSLH
ncbi:hypothetical protein SUDANB105_00250 [Streptomyces sp. enrichment culture]|uniref:hypothetical protein n=1 Tax=Streptomyces sp. enrichment culture TaxID=1795815 RepID=UPI003F56C7AA